MAANFRAWSDPQLLIIEDPSSFKSTDFKGQINKKSIYRFLNENQKQKTTPEIVKEFTRERLDLGSCGKEDKNLCVIILVSYGEDVQEIRRLIKELKESYQKD